MFEVYTIKGITEEFECACGNPVMQGDRAVLNTETQLSYCSRTCVLEAEQRASEEAAAPGLNQSSPWAWDTV